ncbi:hypothetical protein [Desulfosarcina ovata]|nr:hypothetical protein [Desulfosarcina ovata]
MTRKSNALSDPQVEAANEIYKVARENADAELTKLRGEIDAIRSESQALGAIKKINYDLKHNEMLKYVILYHVKSEKEYRKGGMTWSEFCEAIGEQVRGVDKILTDLRPIVNEFSALCSDFIRVPFSKIRYLGRSVSEQKAEIDDGHLIIGDDRIPLTPENKDDIEAAIDALKESHQEEKKKLTDEVSRIKKQKAAAASEEAKSLKVERDAMSREIQRLSVFDPAEKDHTWSVDQMKAVQEAALAFTAEVRRFAMDERIKDDLHVQGQVEGMMADVEKHLRSLRQDWDLNFNCDE